MFFRLYITKQSTDQHSELILMSLTPLIFISSMTPAINLSTVTTDGRLKMTALVSDDLSQVSLTPAIKQLQQYQLAYISKWILNKKSLYECIHQPSHISSKYEKNLFLIYLWCRWHRGLTCTFEYLREFSNKIRKAPNWILKGPEETASWKKPDIKGTV